MYCDWCNEETWGEYYKQEEDKIYCHNSDWCIPEGSCWEQRVCVDFPEFEEWLQYGFTCDGCTPDEEGECTCTSQPT